MPSRTPPHRVRRPLLLQGWRTFTAIHWPYDVDVVRPVVDPRLEIDTFDGRAWVSLTPFLVEGMRAPGLPKVPRYSDFPETNLRTYVRGPDGDDGIWFFSLDVTRSSVVAASRASYGAPYTWARMSVKPGPPVRYTSQRRMPGPSARVDAAVSPGDPIADDDRRDLDDWLTGRWAAYTVNYGRLLKTLVEHPPWPLQRAEVVELTEDATAAAGLPPPDDPPSAVHYSVGVDVKLSPPKPV